MNIFSQDLTLRSTNPNLVVVAIVLDNQEQVLPHSFEVIFSLECSTALPIINTAEFAYNEQTIAFNLLDEIERAIELP